MSREDAHFRLRIPEDLRERVRAAADDNGRSMTAEIIQALEEAYPAPKPEDDVFVAKLMIESLKRQLEQSGWSEEGLGEFKEVSDKLLDEFKNDPELKGDKGAVTARQLNYLISLANPPWEK